MPRLQEVLTGAERAQIIDLARGSEDLGLYPNVTALREPGLLTVVFEPVWVFVGRTQIVFEKLVVTMTENSDAETGTVKRRLSGRQAELCTGRGLEKAALGQDGEPQHDSPARWAALELVDGALKKHGNFGVHGDLSAGVLALSAQNAVVIYDEVEVYSVTVSPRLVRGGEPNFEFRVRKRDSTIDEVVVSAAEAPRPASEEHPTSGPVLGDGDDAKTQPLARQGARPSDTQDGDEDDRLETMDEE